MKKNFNGKLDIHFTVSSFIKSSEVWRSSNSDTLPVLARFYLSLEFLYFTSNAFHSINCTRERRALRN